MVATLVKYAIAGIGVGFLTYCVYFDRKRRSDPQFRIKIMQRRRERELSAKKQSIPALPPLNDPKAIHRFFLEQIQQGEVALSTGAIDEAVQSFALAVVVCGQPTQLLQVLQQSLSPPVFSKLVSALPAVRKIWLRLLILLWVLSGVVAADVDPFHMLPVRKDGKESTKIFKDVISRPDRAHVILVRTLLHQLLDKLPDESANLPGGRVLFRCVLTNEDLSILKRYASYAEASRSPSADAVNEIFSRFLEPVLGDEQDSSYTYYLYLAVALSVVPTIFFCLRTLSVFQLTFVIVIVFAAYELYISAIAKQHSLMSQQPSIPEECLPSSQQSIYTRIKQFFSRRSSDYCDEYFKRLMTSPVTELRPDRIAYTIVGEGVINIFKTLGVSMGLFYEKVNKYVPFYFAVPLTVGALYILLRFTFLSASVSGPVKPKKKRKVNMGKPTAQLTAKE